MIHRRRECRRGPARLPCRTVAVLTWAALTYGALTCPKRSWSPCITTLRGADLRGADLTEANLRGVDLTGAADGSEEVLIRASKSDQQGEGSTRYLGPATLAAVQRYLEAAGHAAGPLFRQERRGGNASATPLGRRQASAPACAAGQPPLTASPAGSAGTRSVAAALASSRRTEPASRSYIRRGSRPPRRGSTSGAKRPPAGLMARRRYQVGGLGGVSPRG